MVKVECDGCKAPYQIDEKRIPATGLKMRCPKCGTNLLVTKPAAGGGDADLPAPRAAAAAGPAGAPPRAAPPRPPPPRPKAPPPPAAAAPAFGEIDEPGPKTRSGFGEIDLMVDLPAPAVPEADLPAVRGAPPPYAAPIPMPPAAGAPFGPAGHDDLDLPMVPSAELDDDLPMPAHAAHADLPMTAGGHADLPSAAGARGPMPGAPPPIKKRAPTVNFGDIDLPMAPEAQEAELPAPAAPAAPPRAPRMRSRTVNFGDIDLPSVPEEAGLPMPGGRGFGEIDLPLVAEEASLPTPAGVGLPVPAGAGLPMPMEAGLPTAAHGAGLPMPAQGAGLPMAAYGAGLPMPAQGQGLPMPAQGQGLPMPAYGAGLPMPAQGQGLPMPVAGGGLPMAAHGQGLPAPVHGGGLPMAAQGYGLPMAMPGDGLPMSAQGQGLPMAMPGGGLPMTADQVGYPSPYGADIGGEAALDGAPRSSAFDDSDRAVPTQSDGAGAPFGAVGIDLAGPARARVGDEAELAPPPATTAEGPVPSQRRPREATAPVKKGNARKIGVFVAVAAALTGGAFSLVPSVGPFGVYFVSDKINAGSHAASLAELRKEVDAKLDEDTHGAASAAIDRCQAALVSLPRYSPASAFCAYVALERGLRFGRRTDDEALAKQLLAKAGDGGGDSAILAAAALDVLAGQLPKARGPVTALAQKNPGEVDVAVVAADVELADKAAAKAAVSAWKSAVGVHKSARTQFGMARALLAAGDTKGAETTARAALAASRLHAGARMLVASVVGFDPAREAEALELLKQVTDAGEVRSAASDGELVEAYTITGNVHLGRSRMSAAEQAFAAALKINPLAIKALIGNGELFYRSSRFSEALARFEAASAADAESIVAKVGIAKSYISLERMKEAKENLKKLREAHKGEPLVILWLGKAEEALGNKREAETAYAEAIKIGERRPEAVDAYVALAHLLSAIGRNDDANARLAEASKKFPDLPALHRAKGEVALQMGRYDEARTELEAALAMDEDLATRFHLGVALRRMRRFEEAAAAFDKVAAVDKDYPGLALERGLLQQETGQTELALESYRKAREKAPDDVDLKLRVGATLVIAGRPLEAIGLLKEVRNARPNSAEANHFLGRALLVKGENPIEAMRYLELAANMDPNRAEYFLYVGWAANELKQVAKAGPALNKAIELDQELGDAYWQRGVLRRMQSQVQDALKDLNTALQKRPSRYEAWATIAQCNEELQKWPEAEKAYRNAIAGNDAQPEWHYRLAKLLDGHGNKAAVLPELEKALEIVGKPDQPRYQWLYDLHFLLAETLHKNPANKARTIEHYERFLELAPPGLNPYREDAKRALAGMGVRVDK